MFKCQSCSSSFAIIRLYNKHQAIHAKIPNLEIPCLYVDCNAKFYKYKSFRMHIYLKHNANNWLAVLSCNVENCVYRTNNRTHFNKHMRNHLRDSPYEIACPFPECNSTFLNENEYNVHICRTHWKDESTDKDASAEIVLAQDSCMDVDDQNIDSQRGTQHQHGIQDGHGSTTKDFPSNTTIDPSNTPPILDATKTLGKMCVNLTTQHYATEPLLQEVVLQTFEAFSSCKEEFFITLDNVNLSVDEKQGIKQTFNDSFKGITDAFDEKCGSLRNTYNRRSFYSKNFNIIMPVEVPLLNEDGSHSGCSYSYIPILDTLKSMLCDEKIREYYSKSSSSSEWRGFFDISDGKIYKDNEFFQKNKNALQVVLFQDAFEVCNPLGASKTKFKIVAVYLVISNIPPHLRSKIQNIKLVLLCLDKYVTEFGWEQILQKVVEDLKELATNGINISVNGECTTFLGAVVAMLGDNLGSHQIGGYTENFSKSHYFCRFCNISREEFCEHFFDARDWRTVESYKKDADEAERKKSIVRGIKKKSPLNELPHFHVAKPGLPPCLAHDLFEGIIQSDMFLAIKYFVQRRWFRIGLLNFRLNDIKLLTEGAVFIPEIKVTGEKTKLTGTASQMRRLMLIFPAAIADVINNFNDPVWKMVLHLRKVCNIVCAPALSMYQVAQLRREIDAYLRLRIQCFSNKLLPKHEFLVHYPSLIEMFGPLKHLQTMRFESKHGYFKKQVKHIPNFKNVTQTLAAKHQLQQSAISYTFDSLVKTKNALEYVSENYDDATRSLIANCFGNQVESAKYIAEKVTFRGIVYKKGMSICIGKNEYNNFMICKIQFIVINSSYTEISFVGIKKEIILNENVGVYENWNNSCGVKLLFFPYSSLLSPHPFPELIIASTPVYLPKYAPFDSDM